MTAVETDLDPSVWPTNARIAADGVLTIGGVRMDELAREFATPALVLDEDDVRRRCRTWREAFGDQASVYYAGKAFLCTAMARWVAQEGLGLDVCTGGELAVACNAGFPVERLLFHGNNKSVVELEAAVAARVGIIAVDSLAEIDRLDAVVRAAGAPRQAVYVRVTPGVEAHTHSYVATGQEDQKFGFSIASGAAWDAITRVLECPALALVGLHAHIGSQIFDTAGFGLAAHRLVTLAARLREHTGLVLRDLDLGGGVGIAYTSEDAPLEVGEVAARLRGIVERECAALGYPPLRLVVEPGRAIVGPGGVTLYEVGTVKELPGLRTYASVDGGMSDNIRTALYGAHYTARLASRRSTAPLRPVTVCGKHCESGDIVIHDVALPADLTPGDLLAVPASGAYHRSMASNYNHVVRPPVVGVAGGIGRILVRRETIADLLALDADVDAPPSTGPSGRGRGRP